MANRAQLSTGSYNKNDTLYAQKLLNEKGGYGLAVDGIYGKKTEAAVRSFQKANGLAVDGILGKNTWAALTKTQKPAETEAPAKTPDYSAYRYDPDKDSAYQALLRQAQKAQKELSQIENPYDDYQQSLNHLKSQLENREAFSYDQSLDPLYGSYKDQYTQQGQMAMLDTMGRAAALTGGYASSYAQAVGQQSYQSYLQKLGAVMPELYSAALERYAGETEAMEEQYSAALTRAKNAQDAYNEKVKAKQNQVSDLYSQAEKAYKRGYDNWYQSYKQGSAAKADLYDSLVNLISKTGYIPESRLLKEAGMSAATAKAYAKLSKV